METSQPTQSTFGPGCRRNIFGNVLYLSDGDDDESENERRDPDENVDPAQRSVNKSNNRKIVISSTSSSDDDNSAHVELVKFKYFVSLIVQP